MYATESPQHRRVAAVSESQVPRLLAAQRIFVGLVFKRSACRLTGYPATGIIIAGPRILNPVSGRPRWASSSWYPESPPPGIALTAGTELFLSHDARLAAARDVMDLFAGGPGTMFLLGGVVMAARSLLPFMAHTTLVQTAAISLLLGVVISAQSPAVVVALRDETNAEGPLARTVLGVVVVRT